jgi:chromosome segregation ATPase
VKNRSLANRLQSQCRELGEMRVRVQQLTQEQSKVAAAARDIARLEQRNHDLDARLRSTQALNEAKDNELAGLRRDAGRADDEVANVRQQLDAAVQKAERVGKRSGELERERQTLQTQVTDLQASAAQSAAVLQDNLVVANKLNEKAKVFTTLETEKGVVERENARLRNHFLKMSQESARRLHDAHNQLHSSRHFLEMLKEEYRDFADAARAQLDRQARAHSRELSTLRTEYAEYQERQVQRSADLYREQQEIVAALQVQFQEYRSTAEALFYSESRKLESRIQAQTAKYEQEIRYIVKAKDQHFAQMVTSKDAKVMNLIEGTDFHKVVTQHQLELNQLKQQQTADLALVRELVEAEHRKKIAGLHRRSAGQVGSITLASVNHYLPCLLLPPLTLYLLYSLPYQDAEIEKYQAQLLGFERKVGKTMEQLKSMRAQHARKEWQVRTNGDSIHLSRRVASHHVTLSFVVALLRRARVHARSILTLYAATYLPACLHSRKSTRARCRRSLARPTCRWSR